MEETSFTKEDAQKLLAENPRCVVIPEGITSFMSYPFADNTEIEAVALEYSHPTLSQRIDAIEAAGKR